jgi:tetratricopeptide (TPR) repeat protein
VPTTIALNEETALAKTDSNPIKAMEKAASVNPTNPDTHRALGMEYFRSWRAASTGLEKNSLAELALRHMDEAIRLSNEDFSLRVEAGIMLYGMGFKLEALAKFDEAVQLYPTRPALRVYRAMLESELGMLDAAAADTDEATRLLEANRMADGAVRHKTLEMDQVKGLPGAGSEQEMYLKLKSSLGK